MALSTSWYILILLKIVANIKGSEAATPHYGKYIGALKSYHHALGGDVYVVDSRTLHIRNFNYDGEGPAGYFYVSNGKTPNEHGTKIRDERGSLNPLRRYRKEHITLTLPEGKTVHNIKWFYAWCDDYAVNFGDVRIPKNIDYPKPQKIGKLNGVHGVSSDNIVAVDAQTLLIPSFSYDGDAPDAKFWVGSGSKPTPQGIRVPDENGKEEPLRRYVRKTIVLTLPGDLTVFDIGHFGVWCEAFTVDFGHVQIPRDLNIPPSLKMLGVSPQKSTRSVLLQSQLAAHQSGLQNQFVQSESYQNNPKKELLLHDKTQPQYSHNIHNANYLTGGNNRGANANYYNAYFNRNLNLNSNVGLRLSSGQKSSQPTTYKPSINLDLQTILGTKSHLRLKQGQQHTFSEEPPNDSFQIVKSISVEMPDTSYSSAGGNQNVNRFLNIPSGNNYYSSREPYNQGSRVFRA